jgi:high-affinity nickel-transport protein
VLVFRHYPVLLGTALVAWTFGLRHAVDADHIAAIDNVTRKLMQQRQRPVAVGFYFSLGHSTIVVLLSILLVIATTALKNHFDGLKAVGGIVGTLVSAFFLFAIAIINIFVLVHVYRTFRKVASGTQRFDEADLNMLPTSGGFFTKLCSRLFRVITQSWQMYFLGFLFGLGFDTATEVGVLGISAAQASKGLPIWSIMVFPVLFTAGMTLIDTMDGTLMLGVYNWALANPLRKLYYNMVVTFVSVVIAVLVGSIELLGILGDSLSASGPFWDTISHLNDNFGAIGALIIGFFVACLLCSAIFYRVRVKRYA